MSNRYLEAVKRLLRAEAYRWSRDKTEKQESTAPEDKSKPPVG